jgi:hypothetical protein
MALVLSALPLGAAFLRLEEATRGRGGLALAATVILAACVTLWARRRGAAAEGGSEPPETDTAEPAPGARPWSLATLGLPLAGAGALGLGLWAHTHADQLRYVLGPPPVSPTETYAALAAGPAHDHSRFDALLRTHVGPGGLVDYAGLKREEASLDDYVAALATARFEEMGRDEKLALLINAYNAFTLRLILDHRPLASIKDIPGNQRWDDRRWRLGGETLSLNQIEHERIRPRFREPRVHFALVCAARGCPPLRAEAYTGERLESQLADQARRIHSDGRWVQFDPASGTLRLTKLYDWYGSDFLQTAPSIEEYVARHEPSVRAALSAGAPVRIRWLPYDWSLNAKPSDK